MLSTLNSLSQASQVRHKKNSPQFLGEMTSESLTLVGFEQCDLEKIHEALEICSLSKPIQTVEVFIEAVEEFLEQECTASPGLCLIKIPKCRIAEKYLNTMLAVSNAIESPNLTMIPVMESVTSISSMPKFIQDHAPYYISIDSEISDFVALLAAYLFDADIPTTTKQPHSQISRANGSELNTRPIKVSTRGDQQLDSDRPFKRHQRSLVKT